MIGAPMLFLGILVQSIRQGGDTWRKSPQMWLHRAISAPACNLWAGTILAKEGTVRIL